MKRMLASKRAEVGSTRVVRIEFAVSEAICDSDAIATLPQWRGRAQTGELLPERYFKNKILKIEEDSAEFAEQIGYVPSYKSCAPTGFMRRFQLSTQQTTPLESANARRNSVPRFTQDLRRQS
jgi:hypothetical protein